jgi:hypothetical protein
VDDAGVGQRGVGQGLVAPLLSPARAGVARRGAGDRSAATGRATDLVDYPVSPRGSTIKYDVEVSGFDSQALGHVCLLNFRDQAYPGSDGTATKGWPTWTTPVLRWTKAQGAVTGYAHSGSGLEINPRTATDRLLSALDGDEDGAPTPAGRAGDLGRSAVRLRGGADRYERDRRARRFQEYLPIPALKSLTLA